MKALKLLVIAMTLMIVIGLGLVGYGLSRKTPHPPVTLATIPGTPENVVLHFDTQYTLLKGAKLEQVAATGDRVVLRLSSPDGDKLVLIDAHTGQVAGTIILTAEAK